MPRTQFTPATDSSSDLRNLVGDDVTAGFESDPRFEDSDPATQASSENLAVQRDTDDTEESEEEIEDEEDEEDEEDLDEDEEDGDEEDEEYEDEEEEDEEDYEDDAEEVDSAAAGLYCVRDGS